jgi:hypothetical protein
MSRPKASIKPQPLQAATLTVLRRRLRVTFSSDGEDAVVEARPVKLKCAAIARVRSIVSTEGMGVFEPALVDLVRCITAPLPDPMPIGFREFIDKEARLFERASTTALRCGDVEFFRQVAALIEFVRSEGNKPLAERKRYLVNMAWQRFFMLRKSKRPPHATVPLPYARELRDVIVNDYGVSITTGQVHTHADALGFVLRAERNTGH